MIQFKQLKTLVAVVALLWISLIGLAQDIPTQPNPPRMVNDFAHQLNPQEINQLEQKLRGYRDSTSTEIAIVIVANTGESDPYDYAIKLAKTWGVGAKKKNNGVVLLWATETRKVRIVTGRGIEGVLPDAICKRIINRNIIPHFKQQAWFAGLDEGTTEMMRRASGEFKADAVGRGSALGLVLIFMAIIIVIIVVIFVIIQKRKGNGGNGFGGNNDGGWFPPVIFMGNDFGNDVGRKSSWGSSDDSGFDFDGFGGGDFGGGGAGGDY